MKKVVIHQKDQRVQDRGNRVTKTRKKDRDQDLVLGQVLVRDLAPVLKVKVVKDRSDSEIENLNENESESENLNENENESEHLNENENESEGVVRIVPRKKVQIIERKKVQRMVEALMMVLVPVQVLVQDLMTKKVNIILLI